MQRCSGYFSHVASLVESRRRLAPQKVHQPLGWGIDGIASGMVHALFNLLLEAQQGKNVCFLYIFRTYGDGNATIGIGRVAAAVAHTVDHLLPVSCGGRHDDATGAHTKGEDTVGTRLSGETLGCRWQVFGISFAVILYFVDEFLWMFHTDAEGKGFCFE